MLNEEMHLRFHYSKYSFWKNRSDGLSLLSATSGILGSSLGTNTIKGLLTGKGSRNQVTEEMVEGIMNVCPGRGHGMECVALIIFKYLKEYYWRE